RSAALANSFAARARGYEAPFWNPANLGLPDRPRWSFGLVGISTSLSNNSLTYGQITGLYGRFLDDATKSKLLADIRGANPDGTIQLDVEAGGSFAGVSVGRFAFAFGTMAGGNADLSADAAELLLFGNDGEDGLGKDFDFSGSSGQGWWMTGGSVSYGHPFRLALKDGTGLDLSFGVTFKYGVSHGLLRFSDRGTVITAEPLAVDALAERVRTDLGDAGRFWAFDLGIAGQWKDLVAGISVHNIVGDVSWDLDQVELTAYRAEADFSRTTTTASSFTYSELGPEETARLGKVLDELDVPTRLRIGGAYRVSRKVSLSADYYDFIGGELRGVWDHTLAVGGEFDLIRVVPLRVGLATNFSQLAITAGAGLWLGVFHADLALGRWGIVKGDGVSLALSVSFWP
ncbi:MAG TPA: hypothetical protein VLC48_01260, partial [Gemmatimonadota bacterium]|nr:hypothetical protein [Gemmatimonadota bacterium]